MFILLAQDRHSRRFLSGDLRQKTRELRLKRFENDDYIRCQQPHVNHRLCQFVPN